jgi:hypothetical protein
MLSATSNTPSPLSTSPRRCLGALQTAVRWRNASGCRGELYLPPLDPSGWVEEEPVENDCTVDQEKIKVVASAGDEELADSVGGLELAPEISIGGSNSRRVKRFSDDEVDPPVEMRIVHRKQIRHRFTNTFGLPGAAVPAVVPVDLYLRNVSSEMVDTTICAPVAGGIADGERGRFWAGLVDASLRSIPPGEERRVSLSAILDGPGTFDLAKLSAVAERRGNATKSLTAVRNSIGSRAGSCAELRTMSVSGPKCSFIACVDVGAPESNQRGLFLGQEQDTVQRQRETQHQQLQQQHETQRRHLQQQHETPQRKLQQQHQQQHQNADQQERQGLKKVMHERQKQQELDRQQQQRLRQPQEQLSLPQERRQQQQAFERPSWRSVNVTPTRRHHFPFAPPQPSISHDSTWDANSSSGED